MPQVYGIGGYVKVAPPPISGNGAPASNFIGQFGQEYLDNSVSPANIYIFDGTLWNLILASGGSGNFTSLTVTTGPNSITGPTSINATGSSATNIGTGGSGAVNIGNATGNTAITGNETVSGSITAGTTITATAGNITATNGNIVKGTAGNKDIYTSVATTTAAGANSAGTVTLVAGTATVATTAVTANSQIRLYRQGVGATGAAALGILTLGTKTAGTSFVINAVTAASSSANQTTDVSVIGWEIVN